MDVQSYVTTVLGSGKKQVPIKWKAGWDLEFV